MPDVEVIVTFERDSIWEIRDRPATISDIERISAELLKWKAIEVAHELSKSPNAKVVVLGDKSGLP